MKNLLKSASVALFALFVLASCSDKSQGFVEGTHWSVIEEPLEYTLKKGEIGVIWEVFSYSCSHCNAFEPSIDAWRAKAPKKIAFEPVPIMWDSRYTTQATAFYTAKLLNVPEQAHGKLFEAIHVARAKIGSIEDFAQFYSKFGINEERFISTSKSFAVKGMVDKAAQITSQGKVKGTPALIVNGKYLITTEMVSDRKAILELAQYLVERDAKK